MLSEHRDTSSERPLEGTGRRSDSDRPVNNPWSAAALPHRFRRGHCGGDEKAAGRSSADSGRPALVMSERGSQSAIERAARVDLTVMHATLS
jgi:hypothetical protein